IAPNTAVPSELADAIGRATARDLAKRFATASALRAALAPWLRASQPALAARPIAVDRSELTTVIVLPPRCPPSETRLYIAEAVHEELLARLLRLPRVRVLARVETESGARVIGVLLNVVDGELAVEITPASGAPTKLRTALAVEQLTAAV